MEQLVNFIIRPPRADYNPRHDLLDDKFMLKGRWFQRKDLKVKNGKGLVLECSHYLPLDLEGKALPCVIYCHGNSGCRSDASEAAIILLSSNITVFTLDFSGSGLSEGEHVTLGWNEKEDLKSVVNHLRTDENVSCIGLWGRSMGAVTSLLYGAEDPSIAGMVLDSPFSNLVDLMMELVDTYKYPLPKFTVKLAIQHMRRVIKKKAAFDIMELDTIRVAKYSFVPALFGHAMDDDFIRPHHSDQIYESYAGDKNIIKFEGDHNSFRPKFYFDSITIFFHNVLNPPPDAPNENCHDSLQRYVDEGAWAASHDIDHLNAAVPQSCSTEHAIHQVRMRRPMSRMEVPSDVSQEKWHEPEENGTSDFPPSSSVLVTPRHVEPDLSTPRVADDQNLDYLIDNFSEAPYSIDDEERRGWLSTMLMHAIMESLKDMEVATQASKEKISSTEATSSETSIEKDSTADLDCVTTSASNTVNMASDLESKSAKCSISARSEVSDSSNDVQKGVNDDSVTSSLVLNNEEMAGTSARLVVQKNPTGQTNSFVQRWGNFFRNNG